MEYYPIMELEEKDLKIFKILKENSRMTTDKISRQTAIPATTVHNRIKKMVKQGIIKRYTIDVNYEKIGKTLSAYILITVDYPLLQGNSQQQLAKKIKSYESVHEISIVAGGTDIIVKVIVKDVHELNDFITMKLRKIKGVEKTQTFIILDEC